MSTEAAVLALQALLEQQKLSGVTELYSVKFVDIRRAIASLEAREDAADSDAAMAEAAIHGTRSWEHVKAQVLNEQSAPQADTKVAAQYVCDARYSQYNDALAPCPSCGWPVGKHQGFAPEQSASFADVKASPETLPGSAGGAALSVDEVLKIVSGSRTGYWFGDSITQVLAHEVRRLRAALNEIEERCPMCWEMLNGKPLAEAQSKGGDDIERTGADPKGSQGIRGAAVTARGASDDNAHCAECGMQLLFPNEYHPYGACLMFLGCHDGATVRSNIAAIRDNGWPTVSDDGPPDQQWHEIAKEPVPQDGRQKVFGYRGAALEYEWAWHCSLECTHWAYASSWIMEGPK